MSTSPNESIKPDHFAYRPQPDIEYDIENDASLREWASMVSSGAAPAQDLQIVSRADALSSIAAIEQELQEAWQRFQGLRYALEKHRFLAAPIRFLPNELLREVFAQLSPDLRALPEGWYERSVLMLVCRQWNETVHSCPSLWSKWYIDDSSRRASTWIRETENLHGPPTLSITLATGGMSRSPGSFEQSMRVSERFKELNIFCTDVDDAPVLWPQELGYCLMHREFPHLAHLQIHFTVRYNPSPQLALPPLTFERLRTLSFQGGFPGHPIIAPRLRSLVLRDLQFTESCVEMLRNCAQFIQNLHLGDMTFATGTTDVGEWIHSQALPDLNNLVSLAVASLHVLAWLSTRVPALVNIHFLSVRDQPPPAGRTAARPACIKQMDTVSVASRANRVPPELRSLAQVRGR
jgi:hypothetical protein